MGLVLSGGGARGAAHVGVLQALEELRVPVDYVAGTSMGAVIGGLFASGIDPDELDDLLAELPWDQLFSDRTRRRDISFRRKQDTRQFLSTLHVGFKDGRFQLPTGLIQGQKLELVLAILTMPVATERDFDGFMIPFRAVATDLSDGSAVVMREGVLADAIRASMAIPGVFSPVERDGRLLVDGGTAMNLPVQVARAMGADVVIAVDISTPLRGQDELDSAFAVTGQTVTIQIQQNTAEQIALLGEGDLLIRPELDEIGTLAFDKVEVAAQAGRVAALAAREALERLSLEPGAWAGYTAGRTPPDASPPLVSEIRVENDTRIADRVIQSRLQVRAGEPLDYDVLAHDVEILYGIDVFDRVNVRVDALPDGGKALVIVTRKRRTGDNRIRFGVELETDFQTSGTFNIGLSATRLPINWLAAEWRNQFEIGENPAVETEFWQPLDDETRWFIAPEFKFRSDTVGLFDDAGTQFAEYRIWDVEGGLSFGRQAGQWGEARIGIRAGRTDADRSIGNPTFFPSDSRDDGAVFVRFSVDTLDNPRFPRSGTVFFAEAAASLRALGAPDDYETVRLAFSQVESFGENTLVFDALAGLNFEDGPQISNLFSLGGFLQLSGLKPNERIGTQGLLFRVRGYRRIAQLGLLSFTLPAYVGGSVETGNTWFSQSDITFDSLLWGGSIYFGLDLPFAPLYLAYGHTEGNRHAAYLFLGQVF